jgi:predicted transcriptional regulator
MTHQLVNFNIPTNLKTSLDKIAKSKCLSRTAIINQLLETYCRTELQLVASTQTQNNQQSFNNDEDDQGMPLVPFRFDQDNFQEGWAI